MIKIPYGLGVYYGINSDKYGYSVGKLATRTIKTKDKNGKTHEETQEYILRPTFPSTLKGCLQVILELKQREMVAENDLTLPQALEKLEQLQAQFSKLLEQVAKKEQL